MNTFIRAELQLVMPTFLSFTAPLSWNEISTQYCAHTFFFKRRRKEGAKKGRSEKEVRRSCTRRLCLRAARDEEAKVGRTRRRIHLLKARRGGGECWAWCCCWRGGRRGGRKREGGENRLDGETREFRQVRLLLFPLSLLLSDRFGTTPPARTGGGRKGGGKREEKTWNYDGAVVWASRW